MQRKRVKKRAGSFGGEGARGEKESGSPSTCKKTHPLKWLPLISDPA